MSDVKLHERASRGRRFRALEDSEDVIAAFEAVEDYFTEAWKTAENPDTAHELWHRVRAVGQVRQHIKAEIADGKLAEAELERAEQLKDQGPGASPRIAQRPRKEDDEVS